MHVCVCMRMKGVPFCFTELKIQLVMRRKLWKETEWKHKRVEYENGRRLRRCDQRENNNREREFYRREEWDV